jgi:hypothetical protein
MLGFSNSGDLHCADMQTAHIGPLRSPAHHPSLQSVLRGRAREFSVPVGQSAVDSSSLKRAQWIPLNPGRASGALDQSSSCIAVAALVSRMGG